MDLALAISILQQNGCVVSPRRPVGPRLPNQNIQTIANYRIIQRMPNFNQNNDSETEDLPMPEQTMQQEEDDQTEIDPNIPDNI